MKAQLRGSKRIPGYNAESRRSRWYRCPPDLKENRGRTEQNRTSVHPRMADDEKFTSAQLDRLTEEIEKYLDNWDNYM